MVRGTWVLDVDSYEFHIEEVFFPVKHHIYSNKVRDITELVLTFRSLGNIKPF